MDQDTIIRYISETFAGIEVLRPADGSGAGDTFFYYDPQRDLDPSHRLPFATIVTKDYGEYDNSSRLDRPGVYRLNIGVGRETFRSLFGYAPGETRNASADFDFAALDRVMPHPVYEPQMWVCVLNPGSATFETVKSLLAEAYTIVTARYERKQASHE
ncbi:MAG TPA: DUF6194 family protein [Ktedonobacterales bacterium]|jgi:hypothetical protein|nr:DUF6194 family protein [Ktedonobacterales bacterium]